MENSPFAKLPAEITNAVAELALYHQDSISINDSKYRHASALARTCKQMRADYMEVFYDLNSFTLHTTNGKTCQSRYAHFIKTIGPTNAGAVGSGLVMLTLTFDNIENGLYEGISQDQCTDTHLTMIRADKSVLGEHFISRDHPLKSLELALESTVNATRGPFTDQLDLCQCMLAVARVHSRICYRDFRAALAERTQLRAKNLQEVKSQNDVGRNAES